MQLIMDSDFSWNKMDNKIIYEKSRILYKEALGTQKEWIYMNFLSFGARDNSGCTEWGTLTEILINS